MFIVHSEFRGENGFLRSGEPTKDNSQNSYGGWGSLRIVHVIRFLTSLITVKVTRNLRGATFAKLSFFRPD